MKNMYIIISATSSRLGKSIRLFTHTPYNHVSISFDGDLKDMISFARYYYQIPFYGGYIHESIERYHNAHILLYKISLDDESYEKIKNQIKKFEENAKDYVYHTINAVLCPFNKEVYIECAYTCLSFAMMLLSNTELDFPKIYSIKEFMNLLEPYKIYEGNIEHFFLHSDPSYLKQFKFSEKLTKTYHQQKQLFTRILQKDA